MTVLLGFSSIDIGASLLIVVLGRVGDTVRLVGNEERTVLFSSFVDVAFVG